MLVTLLFVHFLLFFLLILGAVKKVDDPFATTWVVTLISHAVISFVCTEFLSLFNLITKLHLSLIWLGLTFALLTKNALIKRGFSKLRIILSTIKFDPLLLVYSLLIILPLLFSAIWFAPNNGDGMRYHLLRIEHWIWNKNVDFFPINDIRNLSFNPLAEYIALQFRALSGSDYLVQLIQWSAFTGILAGVYLLTGVLSLTQRARKLSVLATGTTAMLIFEATTVQNDLVASFFLVTSLWIGFKLAVVGFTKNRMLLLMLSLGLGAATKLIVPMLLLIPCLMLLPSLIKDKWYQRTYFWLSIPLSIFFMIPNIYRNLQTFNHPLQPPPTHALYKGVGNEAFEPAAIIGNLLKHTGNLVAMPFAHRFNEGYKQLVYVYYSKISKDINDPKYNYARNKEGPVFPFDCSFKMSEDAAVAFPTVLLFLLASIASFFALQRSKQGRHVAIVSIITISFVLIVSIFIKYSPWSARHLIPALMLCNIPTGWWLARISNFSRAFYKGIGIALVFSALWPVYFNPYKRIIKDPISREKSHFFVPRMQHYFLGWPGMYQTYADLSVALAEYKMPIATCFSETATEYPLIVMLRTTGKEVAFECIGFQKDLLKIVGNQPVDTGRKLILTDVALLKNTLTDSATKTINTFAHFHLISLQQKLNGYFIFESSMNEFTNADIYQKKR